MQYPLTQLSNKYKVIEFTGCLHLWWPGHLS